MNGGLQADAVIDFKTDSNSLSLYVVEDDRSNLHQITAALAANADSVSNVDYALFDKQLLINEGFVLDSTIKGNTPDLEVNDWHLDLIQLTAQSLGRLIEVVHVQGEKQRLNLPDVKLYLKQFAPKHDPTKVKLRNNADRIEFGYPPISDDEPL